ncbi:hypothetical protein N825_01190 [Skermanella stibiiresistens SB22]|uniref:Glycosyl transferase family 1 domain-containing protein n=2 Tax=Skermanella TaxID=204447 RepID=W9HDQ8_9PROT|nr:hypothetical protein N825_01190 [Skermanella stibiiresistens SB22]
MFDVLTECGFEVVLIGEHFDDVTLAKGRTMTVDEAIKWHDFAILIYHHSIIWEKGETLLRLSPSRLLMKYHNITPADFFADYSPNYWSMCATGREQTARLVALFDRPHRFMADSIFNATELVEAGANPERITIVPPFTHVNTMMSDHAARPLPAVPYTVLFVGRIAPNKGHMILINTIHAYLLTIGPGIKLRIVGGQDENLLGYRERIVNHAAELGVLDHIEFLEQVSPETLRGLFADSSLFLCTSEHEGFCVPIIEAQASGLPVVSVNSTAIGETAGLGQILLDPPRSFQDYAFFARMIHDVCTNERLRRNVIAKGRRNVLSRFTKPVTADLFINALAPVFEELA